MSRRSLRRRSKSFHRHSRRTGEYDVIGNSNDDEVNRVCIATFVFGLCITIAKSLMRK